MGILTSYMLFTVFRSC